MGDETASSSKLDALSKEELIKLVKKYVVLHKQLKTKNEGERRETIDSKFTA